MIQKKIHKDSLLKSDTDERAAERNRGRILKGATGKAKRGFFSEEA